MLHVLPPPISGAGTASEIPLVRGTRALLPRGQPLHLSVNGHGVTLRQARPHHVRRGQAQALPRGRACRPLQKPRTGGDEVAGGLERCRVVSSKGSACRRSDCVRQQLAYYYYIVITNVTETHLTKEHFY